MKRESRTICSWNITAPEFNRVWVRISVLDSKEENSTVCPNYLKVSFQILCIMFSISAPFTLQASLIKISIFVNHFPPFFKLEEIKDNQKSLLKRYCTPVDRDYIKSNSSKILVTAYNIKFKISWNGISNV